MALSVNHCLIIIIIIIKHWLIIAEECLRVFRFTGLRVYGFTGPQSGFTGLRVLGFSGFTGLRVKPLNP